MSDHPSKKVDSMYTAEAIRAESTALVQRLEGQWAHEPRESRWERLRRPLAMTWRRVKSIATGEARRIDAHEYLNLKMLVAKLEAHNERQESQLDEEFAAFDERLSRLESSLLQGDAEFHRLDIDAARELRAGHRREDQGPS